MTKTIYEPAYRALVGRLRQRRVELGLRQDDVGKRLGLSADWISKIENGITRLDLVHLVRLCRVYDVPADDLVRRIQEELPE